MVRVVKNADGTYWSLDGEVDTEKGAMWLTVADSTDLGDMQYLRMEKAHVHTYGWNYTGSHHLDVYGLDDNHQRLCSIAALVARFGNMCPITEVDKDGVVREPQGSGDVPSAANFPWLRQRLGINMALTNKAHQLSEEIREFQKYKTRDSYAAGFLGPLRYV